MSFNEPKNKLLIDAIEAMFSNKEFVATANERHERATERVKTLLPHIRPNNGPVHVSALSLETAYPDDEFGKSDLTKNNIIAINSCLLSLLYRVSSCNCSDCNEQVIVTTACMKKLMAVYHSLPYE